MIFKLCIAFAVFAVLTTAVDTAISTKTTATSTTTTNTTAVNTTTTTTQVSVGKTSRPNPSPGTKTPAATTPIQCKVGDCSGTSDDCLNSNSTINQQDCKSGGSCALVQKDSNGTYSHYTFSCAMDCTVLTSQGIVACCSTANCTPDLSKPVKNNSGGGSEGDSGGDSTVPSSIISFLGVAVISFFVM